MIWLPQQTPEPFSQLMCPPRWLCGNTAPVLCFETDELALAGLAVLNSTVFDWMARRVVGGLHLDKLYLARLAWPRLSKNSIGRLTDLSCRLGAEHPRAGMVVLFGQPSPEPSLAGKTAVFAAVEVEVARAYGLTLDGLTVILANDRTDRRGLWRYFASGLYARDVARLALDAFSDRKAPSSQMAA